MSHKFGRKHPKNAPSLHLKTFLKGVPDHPVAVDHLKALGNWQMLGNDYFGVCGPVTAANMTRVITSALTGKEYYPTQAEVFALYRTQNPNFTPDKNNPVEDNGVDVQTLLEYWQKNSWGGRKIVAFARVDFTNLEEVKAAIAIFGVLFLGINVQVANETQFDRGQPWDYVKGSPTVGGHAIAGGGYGTNAKADIDFVTWAKETSFTDNDVAKNWEEAWVVIFPEHLGTVQFQQGIDQTALAAAYTALTGKPWPVVPTPPTPPIPTPPPVTPTWQITSQTPTRIILDLK